MISDGVKIVLEGDFKSKIFSRVYSISENNKKTIYTPAIVSKKRYLNFINTYFEDYYDATFKPLVEKIIMELEAAAPGTSDLFLDILIDCHKNNNSVEDYIKNNFQKEILRLEKDDVVDFIDDIENIESKLILKKIIEVMEYDDQVFVDSSVRELTLIKKSNEMFFNVNFDKDFLVPFDGKWERDHFKFIIIDGFIDSPGEIHHLLHNASEDKEPYVIFCKGMRAEVKHTIIHNLQRKTIDVMPISLMTNEENVNVLNDIASCLDSDIISSLKGDVISVEVRRELSTGEKIRINNKGFYLKCQNKEKIKRQLMYLKRKINSINTSDPNFKYIEKRIRTLESKKLEIFLSKNINNNSKSDLDYFLKLLKNSKLGIVKTKDINSKKDLRSFYTVSELATVFKKVKSLINTIDSLGCIVCKE